MAAIGLIMSCVGLGERCFITLELKLVLGRTLSFGIWLTSCVYVLCIASCHLGQKVTVRVKIFLGIFCIDSKAMIRPNRKYRQNILSRTIRAAGNFQTVRFMAEADL